MTRARSLLVLTLVLGLFVPANVQAGDDSSSEKETSFRDNYKDPEDSKFDILGPRKTQSGLLPIIIPFNEPAVGIGAVGGLYADNGTWAVAGGHMGIWDGGDIRYLGGFAYASVNLDFYGIGNDSEINSNPIPYHIEGGGTVQQIQFLRYT